MGSADVAGDLFPKLGYRGCMDVAEEANFEPSPQDLSLRRAHAVLRRRSKLAYAAPQLVLLAVANIGIWGGTGFNMVVLYTSLKSVPSELYEAATLDGCDEVRIATRIKVPMILPSLIMTAVFSIIATLQVFAEPMLLRPLTNSISTTWSPLMRIYRDAFIQNDIYIASAGSVLVALATFVISFGFLRLVRGQAFAQEER